MADSTEKVLVKIEGDATGVQSASKKAKSSVKEVGDEAEKSSSKGRGMGGHFSAGAAVVAAGAAVGVKALYNFGKSGIQAYEGVRVNIERFQQVASNAGWSQQMQSESTKAFGVIGIGAARTAAQTAASMGLTGESFNKLKGPMGDLAVKMGGVAGANEQMGNVSTAVSRAIATGSASRLARYGVVLDENTQKQFKNANQQQRAEIIANALNKSVGGLNEKLAQTPAGQMQQLSTSISAVKSNFGGLLTGDVTPDAFLASVNKMVDQGVQLFATMAPKLAQGVATMATAVAQAAPKIITGLVQGILPMLPQLISALATAIPQVVRAITGAIPQIIQAIMQALPQLIQGLIQLVLALVTALPQIIQALIAAIPQVIQLLITAIMTNLPALITGGIQLIMALVTALPQIIMALVQAMPQILKSLVQGLITAAPLLWQGFTQIFSGAIQIIKQIFGVLTQWFGQIWEGIKQVFAVVGEWFGQVFTSAVQKIKDIFGAITGWFGQVWDGVKNVWNGAIAWFGNIGRGIWDGITNALGGLGRWFSGLWNGIVDGVRGAFDSIVDKFRHMGESIWGAIRGGLKTVLSNVPVVGGAIVNALHLASGGRVGGQGTDTSDNQLAALSPGEYVVNAKMARRIGYGTLEMINRRGQVPAIPVGGGDKNMHIEVYTQGSDALAIAQQLDFMMRTA